MAAPVANYYGQPLDGSAKGIINLSLTTSFQVITTGQAYGSDIVALSATNESATSKTITFADDNDNVLCAVELPPSAGQSYSNTKVDLMAPWALAGLEPNPFGGYVFHLPVGKVLKAKITNITGGVGRLYCKRKDYQSPT